MRRPSSASAHTSPTDSRRGRSCDAGGRGVLYPVLRSRSHLLAPKHQLMSEIGLILALGCALISGVALLCKHRGAVDAPDVALRSPLRSASALFRSRWWAIGFALAFFAWCLHVAALSMAPLSLVQAVIAGGLALLAIPARRWFGIAVCRREVVGMVLCASGLVFLALTAGHGRPGGGFAGSTMVAFEGGALALGGLLLWASAQHRHRAADGSFSPPPLEPRWGSRTWRSRLSPRPFPARRLVCSAPGPPSPSSAGSAPRRPAGLRDA